MSRLDEIEARVNALRRAPGDDHKYQTASWKLLDHAREDVPWLVARCRELEAGQAKALEIAHTRRLIHHHDPTKFVGYGDFCAACTVTMMVDALAGGERG